jgi:hypothetical protein
VYQHPRGITLAYNLCLGCLIVRWKGIIEEVHFWVSIEPLDIIEVINHHINSFSPSKWPKKFRNSKFAKNSKFLEDCFEKKGICGLPSVSTWIGRVEICFWGLKIPHKEEYIFINTHTSPRCYYLKDQSNWYLFLMPYLIIPIEYKCA